MSTHQDVPFLCYICTAAEKVVGIDIRFPFCPVMVRNCPKGAAEKIINFPEAIIV